MDSPTLLTLEEVLELHLQQIALFGGSAAILNLGLIESAVAMPQQTFSGQYLHEDLASMAAAYLFHIASNHGFADGNKRTAADAAIVFLLLNGLEFRADPDELADLTLAVASRQTQKPAVTEFIRAHVIPA